MTTIKSSSKNRFSSMFKQTLKAQLPFAIASGIFCIIWYPVMFLTNMADSKYHVMGWSELERAAYYKEYFADGVYADFAMSGFTCFVLGVLALAAALVANSYMHSKKRVDLYHSLPVTRPQYLTANLLASFLSITVPFTFIYIITMLMQVVGYGRYSCFTNQYLTLCVVDYFSILVFVLVIYALTTLISVNVSTVFDTLAITGTIGFIPIALYGIVGAFWSTLTYGAEFHGSYALMLSPFLYVFQRFFYVDYAGGIDVYRFGPMVVQMLIWLVLAVLMFLGAVFFYKRRKSEIAGQTMPQGALQITVMLFASFCGAILFYVILNDAYIAFQIAGMLFGAVLIGIIAAMIFGRGAKKLPQSILWLLAGGGIACVMLIVILLDSTGYVTRVPQVERVESVRVKYEGRFEDMSDWRGDYSSYSYGFLEVNVKAGALLSDALTDPATIQVVVDMHNKTVQNAPGRDIQNSWASDEDYAYNYITFAYKLKNGRIMTRMYRLVYQEAMEMLVNLEDKDEFIAAHHPVFVLDQLEGIPQTRLIEYIQINDSYGSKDAAPIYLQDNELERLLEAMRSDMLAETLDSMKNPTQPALGYVKLGYDSYENLQKKIDPSAAALYEDSVYGVSSTSAIVLITPEYTKTVAVLRELGLDHLLTAPKIDKLYILSSNVGDRWTDGRINVVRADKNSSASNLITAYKNNELDARYDYNEQPLKVFETSDPTEIRQIDAAAHTQLYMQNAAEYYVVVAAEVDGRISCYKWVHKDVLPEKLQRELTEYMEPVY